MKRQTRKAILAIFACTALAIDAGAGEQNRMTVSFNEKNVLQSITVGAATFATGGGDLWTAEFSDGTNRAKRVKACAHEAATCTRTETDAVLTLTWRDVPLGGERGVLDATVTIEKRPDGSQAWNLAFANRSPRWTLMTTAFPRLNRVTPDGAGDVLLPSNDHGAQIFRKRTVQPKPFRRAYLGYCPMIAGFFLGTDGLYFVPEDPEARIKNLLVEGEQNACYETTVENAGVPGRAAEGPRYPVVLAPLKGDWWSFARRYRAYALKQKWAARGPIKDIPDYPRRLCEIPLWINIHGYPDVASNILTRAKAIFPGFSTGLHWHLWQHSGHDVNYPEYFPAQPGTKECIAYCESMGQEPMPYVNGRLWSAPTSGFILAEPYAVLRQNDTRYVEKYGRLTAPLAVMCPTCAPWQKVVRTFTGRILDELGAKSIFIDQIGAAPGVPCYDPAHGHPLGGGAWWREGYEKMMAPIHRAWNAKGAFITTEGSGEMCLNMVDGYLQVVVRDPKDVPFHNAVYSGYTTYFCSPENNDDDPAAFRALQTRELLWGNALGWFLPDILDKPDKCAILNQLCAFRQKNLDALAYGNLLDELRFAEPVGKTTYEWLGRRPHHSLYDPAYKLPPSKFATLADVRGNWWRTADGKVVLLAANLTDREQRVVYRVYGTDKTAVLVLAPHELVRIKGA